MDKINTAQPTIDQDNRRYVESTRVYCAIYRQERATWNACSSGILSSSQPELLRETLHTAASKARGFPQVESSTRLLHFVARWGMTVADFAVG